MVGTMPVILALGATLFAHERLPALGWCAIAVSTAGAALIALSHTAPAAAGTAGPSLRGDLLIVTSCAIALFWILLNQRLLRSHDTRTVTAWGLALGTLMLLTWVIPTHGLPPVRNISLAAWAALAASGILCTATTTLLWNWGMTQVPASQAGVLLNVEPLMGSILGITLLHDRLGPAAWLGGAMILTAAITLTTRQQLATHPAQATLEAHQPTL